MGETSKYNNDHENKFNYIKCIYMTLYELLFAIFLRLIDDAYLENFAVVVTPANNESVDNCGNNTMSWSRIIFKVSYY